MAILTDSLSSRSVSDYQLWLTLKMATAVEKTLFVLHKKFAAFLFIFSFFNYTFFHPRI